MQYLTGNSIGEGYSVGNTLSYITGNFRSIIWFLDNKQDSAIVTLRVSLLQNSCQLYVNNVFITKSYIEASGCIINSTYHNITFQVIVSTCPEDSTRYNYSCKSSDARVFQYSTFPFLSPLKNYLNVSIYYDINNMQYEFQVIEYRWNVRILIKSIEDIRSLDRNIRSIYQSYSKELPTLPKLKLASSATCKSIDSTIVASDLQEYFNIVLSLESSAYCPDLLEFFELPISLSTFKYHNPTGTSVSDGALFLYHCLL